MKRVGYPILWPALLLFLAGLLLLALGVPGIFTGAIITALQGDAGAVTRLVAETTRLAESLAQRAE